MTFHADFWVATATAAPVIALAAIVSTGESIRQFVRTITTDLPLRSLTPSIRLSQANNWVNLANIGMQILVFGSSLKSLLNGNDFVSPIAVSLLTLLGLVLLGIAALLSGLVSLSIARHKLQEISQIENDPSSHQPRLPAQPDAETEYAETEEESP